MYVTALFYISLLSAVPKVAPLETTSSVPSQNDVVITETNKLKDDTLLHTPVFSPPADDTLLHTPVLSPPAVPHSQKQEKSCSGLGTWLSSSTCSSLLSWGPVTSGPLSLVLFLSLSKGHSAFASHAPLRLHFIVYWTITYITLWTILLHQMWQKENYANSLAQA